MNESNNVSVDQLVEASQRMGMLRERNRIMTILIQYREAGWIDSATATLLAQDVSPEAGDE